jgi:hypothetical protein
MGAVNWSITAMPRPANFSAQTVVPKRADGDVVGEFVARKSPP